MPVLWWCKLDELNVDYVMGLLKTNGSYAAPGFMKPEGIVIYHTAANMGFKKTFEKDSEGKGNTAKKKAA